MKDRHSSKNRKSWKREVLEWIILLSIPGLLYVTGLHTEVLGRMQQALLWTGLMQPDIEHSEYRERKVRADYSLELISLEGEKLDLGRYRDKVIFINFWATWCPPCIAEMPNIQSLYEKVGSREDVVFVMVSLDESRDKARSFIQRKEFTFPVYILGARRPPVFQSEVVPTTFVVDKSGNIVASREGMAEYDTPAFRKFLLKLAGQS